MTETRMTTHDLLIAAQASRSEGRLEESERGFVKLLGSDLRADALCGLALIAIQRDELQRAIALLEQSLGVRHRNAEAHYQLGRLRLGTGTRGGAIAAFAAALAYDPGHQQALAELAALANSAAAPSTSTNASLAPQATPTPAPPIVAAERAEIPTTAVLARPPHEPLDAKALVGIARNVQKGVGPWRGKPAAIQIWTFRVETYDERGNVAAQHGVEMRGHEIKGTLDNGDWVEISEPTEPGQGFEPKEMRNLTTAEVVKSRMRWLMA